jgi:hypothetical protein
MLPHWGSLPDYGWQEWLPLISKIEANGQPTKCSPQADIQIRDDYSRKKSASPVLGPQSIGSRRMS